MHTVHSADLYYIWFYPIDALAERVESESTISLADKEQDSLQHFKIHSLENRAVIVLFFIVS